MKILTSALGVILLLVIIAAVIALPVMWLWNGLMPEIFGLALISFKQALGLSILSGLLFKSTSSSSSN